MNVRHLLLACAGLLLSAPALALNILLTNDDGYRHPNIRALYQELKAQGHTVRIAAPYADQSGRAGAFLYGREVVPAYPDSYYVKTTQDGTCQSPACAGQEVTVEISGTPVMAALYGLEKVLPRADLVISGPNVGNNLGYVNNFSGTFNAALIALHSGVPALAVSADLKERDAAGVADSLPVWCGIWTAPGSPARPCCPRMSGSTSTCRPWPG